MNLTRRDMLKWSGAALGTAAFGTRAIATPAEGQYIMDVGDTVERRDIVAAERVGLEVDRRIDEIGYIAVEGEKSDIKKLNYDWAPDLRIERTTPDAVIDPDGVPAEGGAEPSPPEVEVTPSGPKDRLEMDAPGFSQPTYWPYQWDKQRQHLPSAHQTADGSGTRVAVIDSGVNDKHPDLSVNTNLSKNFTGDGQGAHNNYGGYHGSHVGGIVAGQGAGMIGTAPGTDLVDCRVFTDTGGAKFSWLIDAVVYSGAIGADAANMSLGLLYPASSVTDSLLEFLKTGIGAAIDYATQQGTVVVVAAGNDGKNIDGRRLSAPSELGNVVNVSATGPSGFLDGDGDLTQSFTGAASYTNVGTRAIDIGAPGGNGGAATLAFGPTPNSVFSTFTFPPRFSETQDPVHTWGWLPGTSMASPQVAGAVALIRDAHPDATPQEVYDMLTYTAETQSAAGFTPKTHGNGFVRPDLAAEADPESVATGSGRGPSSGRGGRSGRGSGRGGDHSSGTAGSGGSRGRGSGRGNQSGRGN